MKVIVKLPDGTVKISGHEDFNKIEIDDNNIVVPCDGRYYLTNTSNVALIFTEEEAQALL